MSCGCGHPVYCYVVGLPPKPAECFHDYSRRTLRDTVITHRGIEIRRYRERWWQFWRQRP